MQRAKASQSNRQRLTNPLTVFHAKAGGRVAKRKDREGKRTDRAAKRKDREAKRKKPPFAQAENPPIARSGKRIRLSQLFSLRYELKPVTFPLS